MNNEQVTIGEVMTAHKFFQEPDDVIDKGVLLPTKLVISPELAKKVRCAQVYLKPENLQRTGSYKVRGAYYKIATMPEDQKKRGIVTASAGNHAQGVAFSAVKREMQCCIFMPRDCP